MGKISFFIHSSISKEVSECLPEIAGLWTKNYTATEKNLFQNLKWQINSLYSVVVMPGSWAQAKWSLPPEAMLACIQGTMRLVFWRAEAPPSWAVPMTVIPTHLSPELTKVMMNHVCRMPAWGLSSWMPVDSKIYSERARPPYRLNEKFEQVLELTAAMEYNPGPSPEVLKASLQNFLDIVLKESDLKMDAKPLVFQMGFHKQFLACSMRWESTQTDFKTWLKPESKWQSIFLSVPLAVVQVNNEVQESEVMLVLGQPATPIATPVIVDVLNTARLKIATDLEDLANKFQFEYFEKFKRASGE